MAIPSTTAPIKHQDFTLTPVKINKQYNVTNLDLSTTASGYTLHEALYAMKPTHVGANIADNDPINLVDNSYKHIIWKHVNNLYYQYSNDNARYVFKHLTPSASYMTIPHVHYGESIQKKSLEIKTNNYTIVDDGNGNLYDIAAAEDIPKILRDNIIGYWGFNSEFKRFNNKFPKNISTGLYEYEGQQFDVKTAKSIIHNVDIDYGNNNSGFAAEFNSNYGYILTPHNKHFNFDNADEFTISFWFRPDDTGAMISKNGVEFQHSSGFQPKQLSENVTVLSNYISSSYKNDDIDRYPFDFYYNDLDEKIYFNRSDGSVKLTMSHGVTSSSWNHCVLTRYKDNSEYKIAMFVNGESPDIVTDTTKTPINNHAVMFGSRNIDRIDRYSGRLDEIRFVNKSYYSNGDLDLDFYHKLSNPDYMFNTIICGNVFYKHGAIVISSLNNKYKDILKGTFDLKFRGTHTIYQYETLCRIKKGSFNLTVNPTSLKSVQSDEIANEFTGSNMMPYFTTIGLYNDKNELMVIAKMGQPIQVRDDVNINVSVKWDY